WIGSRRVLPEPLGSKARQTAGWPVSAGLQERGSATWPQDSTERGKSLAEICPAAKILQRPEHRQHNHGGDEDDDLQRQAETPVIGEAVTARSHHQQVVLVSDRRQKG